MSLKDNVVVITGASKGIGHVAAKAFAKEGALVVASARTVQGPGSVEETVREIKREGGQAIALRCDVTVPAEVQSLIKNSVKAYGRIDVLINNAGVTHWTSIADFTPEEWEGIFAINVHGVFYGCKYVLPVMTAQHSGSIINVSSSQAQKTTRNHLAYSSSKAAVDRFSINLGHEVKEHGIAVHSYWPGHVVSAMSRRDAQGNIVGGPDPTEAVLPSLLWLAQQDVSVVTGQILDRFTFGKTWGPGITTGA